MSNGETVFIVDSDDESREKVSKLVQSMQLRHRDFASGEDFLEQYDPGCPGCVILEVRIADTSGLRLQEQLAEHAPAVPVIFVARHASVATVVRAIQQGAVNFLQKPADEQDLWDSIHRALEIDRERRAALAEIEQIRSQLGLLTDKELQVFELLAQEKTTRAIAHELDVSVRTVEFRRARMLEKLELQNPLQLFHFALRALEPEVVDTNGNGNGRKKMTNV